MRKLVVLVVLLAGCAPRTKGPPAQLWRENPTIDRQQIGTFWMEGETGCVLRLNS